MDTPDGSTIVLGGTTLALLIKEGFAWLRSRSQKTTISPDPLRVEKINKDFVTRSEFAAHVADNNRDHENMFARLNANDKLTSRLEGLLTGMRDDLSAIKHKLFKTTR